MSKILFLLEDYNYFYSDMSIELLSKDQNLSYDQLKSKLLAFKHYQSDSLSTAFEELGHQTQIVVPEANPLQMQWLREKAPMLFAQWQITKPIRSIRARIFRKYRTAFNPIQFRTLLAQVNEFKPDIIYYYSNIVATQKQLEILKRKGAKVVLQWSCPLWEQFPDFPYKDFDLIVTSALQIKEHFDSLKYRTFYMPQAFDERIVKEFKPKGEPKGDLLFVGSITLWHKHRLETLEFLLKNKIDLTVHGTGHDLLPENSLLKQKLREPLYGINMYNEYRNYRMAIHIHTTGKTGDGMDWNKYTGAKRIFEITGSGTLLLTPYQENIGELFEIGKEVVTFKDNQDLLDKIRYYRQHHLEAETIAFKGMQRTLRDHSFKARAKELTKVIFN